MSPKFIAEDKGIDIDSAKRVSQFLSFCYQFSFINDVSVWVKTENIRVYFEIKSQNRFYAVDNCQKTYYCAIANQLFFDSYRYGQTTKYEPERVVNFDRGMFSGAKTREMVKEFCREFITKKADWS